MKIINQNLYGGNQQFADIIINNSRNNIDESDRKILQLIHNHAASTTEKNELIKNLEKIKSLDIPNESKKESGGVLKKFMESIATEGGKQLIKEVIESGLEYVQYLT